MDTPTAAPNLPSSTCFVDSLISEIADIKGSPKSPVDAGDRDPPRLSTAPQEKQAQNVLAGLSTWDVARIKPIILTLHCLFPNDLLPALDILDRKLVQRLVNADTGDTVVPASDSVTAADQSKEPSSTRSNPELTASQNIFLVTSASVPPHGPGTQSTTPTHEHEKGYEVRLQAWNCTCPTFAISAFRDLDSRRDLCPQEGETGHDRDESVAYPFGGTLPCPTDRDSPPVCKHILACVLFARCPALFGGGGDGSRRVSVEELAGWCAGWGG